LAGTWYDTAEVRDASDYETRVRFLKAGIPLGWIGVAAGPEEDPGESIVAELQRRSGLVAMALLIRCREIAIRREIATVFAASSAGATDVAGCIHSVLGSLSVAIEGTLPETDYASAELREFVLVRDRDMRLVGRWRRSDIVIDVSRILLDRARWVGKFSSVESSVIEEVIGEEIFGDFELLPGFTRLPSDQEDSATFALLPASIEAIWAMRQVIDRNVGPEPAATSERTPPLGIKTA